jgi:hypothetical protein
MASSRRRSRISSLPNSDAITSMTSLTSVAEYDRNAQARKAIARPSSRLSASRMIDPHDDVAARMKIKRVNPARARYWPA